MFLAYNPVRKSGFALQQVSVDSLYHIFTFYLSAVGYSPGDSSSTNDFSILRLSTEVPFGIKAALKPCSDKCTKKSERKPNELALSFGFSEIVGRLAIGFGEKNYELAALSRKLYGGGWEKRYVFKILSTSTGAMRGGCIRGLHKYGQELALSRLLYILKSKEIIAREV